MQQKENNVSDSNYRQYIRKAVQKFKERRGNEDYYLLPEILGSVEGKKILDVGCGAGLDLIPFAEKKAGLCVGTDIAQELRIAAEEVYCEIGKTENIVLVRSAGENLPFEDETFDAVVCQVALPYMNNKKAIREMARVLNPKGILFLKIHAPAYFFGLLKERAKTLNPKQIAYPLICLAGGTIHEITGKQLQEGFWQGKEIFQTQSFLQRELAKHNLKIKGNAEEGNRQTPTLIIEKEK